MLASINGYFEIVKLLLNNGALVEAKNNTDVTSLMLASHYGYLEITELLLDNGAIIEAKDELKMEIEKYKFKNRFRIGFI